MYSIMMELANLIMDSVKQELEQGNYLQAKIYLKPYAIRDGEFGIDTEYFFCNSPFKQRNYALLNWQINDNSKIRSFETNNMNLDDFYRVFKIFNSREEFEKYFDIGTEHFERYFYKTSFFYSARHEYAKLKNDNNFLRQLIGQDIKIGLNTDNLDQFVFTVGNPAVYNEKDLVAAILKDSDIIKKYGSEPRMESSNFLTFAVTPFIEPHKLDLLYQKIQTKIKQDNYEFIRQCFKDVFQQQYQLVKNQLNKNQKSFIDDFMLNVETRLNLNSFNLFDQVIREFDRPKYFQDRIYLKSELGYEFNESSYKIKFENYIKDKMGYFGYNS